MKWTFLLVIAVFTNFLGTPVFAQDDDIDSTRRLYRELDELESWCDDVVRKIDSAENRAIRHQRRGEFSEAIDAYLAGMRRAQETGRLVTGLMTKRALQRGITTITDLKNELGGSGRSPNLKGLRTTLWYASHYADFVRNVAEDLDKVHMAPRRRCGDCRYDREEEFEQKYVWFVGETVKLGTDALTFSRNGENYPIGYGKALLMSMKSAAGYAARDLRESLWSTYYACTIEDLDDLASDIDPNDPRDRDQLEDFWYPMKDISNQLWDPLESTCRHASLSIL